MFLLVKKEKLGPRSTKIETKTLAFTDFNKLEEYLVRNGLENCDVYEANKVSLRLVIDNDGAKSAKAKEDVSA